MTPPTPRTMTLMKHDWVPLCSDINTPHWATRHWWKCANCKEQIECESKTPKPSEEGCEAQEKGSIFPLSSI